MIGGGRVPRDAPARRRWHTIGCMSARRERPQAASGRRIFRWLTGLAFYCAMALALAADPIRVGLTPVFLDDQVSFLRDWRRYLEARLDRPVQFVRRASYAEIVDLLRQGKLDFAWLCGYPYVMHRSEFRLLATPVYRGQPLYQSYLLVPARDTLTRDIAGLKGKVFAYSDPNSNSGYLVAQNAIARLGEPSGRFFRKTFFTGSHRGVIEAVARGLAAGGVVDGYVYEALAALEPKLIERTRIVERSPLYGFPPFVVHRRVPPALAAEFQQVLLAMNRSLPGQALLNTLRLDGFAVAEERHYDEIARMARSVQPARP